MNEIPGEQHRARSICLASPGHEGCDSRALPYEGLGETSERSSSIFSLSYHLEGARSGLRDGRSGAEAPVDNCQVHLVFE